MTALTRLTSELEQSKHKTCWLKRLRQPQPTRQPQPQQPQLRPALSSHQQLRRVPRRNENDHAPNRNLEFDGNRKLVLPTDAAEVEEGSHHQQVVLVMAMKEEEVEVEIYFHRLHLLIGDTIEVEVETDQDTHLLKIRGEVEVLFRVQEGVLAVESKALQGEVHFADSRKALAGTSRHPRIHDVFREVQ